MGLGLALVSSLFTAGGALGGAVGTGLVGAGLGAGAIAGARQLQKSKESKIRQALAAGGVPATPATPAAEESPVAKPPKADDTGILQEEERRRRARLLSGIATSPLGVRPGAQTVGRASLLG